MSAKWNKFRQNPMKFFDESQYQIFRRISANSLFRKVLMSRVLLERLAYPGESLPLWKNCSYRIDKKRIRQIKLLGEPLVSIVMAAKNAEKTIESSLNSLINQTYKNLEIIVVNDGSTDSTGRLATQISSREPRIKVISHEKSLGVARARNTGMAQAKGQYITFQDSDDKSSPLRISKQLHELVSKPNKKVVLCNYQRVNSKGKPYIINGQIIRTCVISMMFPKDPVLDTIGYFRDFRIAEDTEFRSRIRSVYGRCSEALLFDTLYFAKLRRDSLHFGNLNLTSDLDTLRVSYKSNMEMNNYLSEIHDTHFKIQESSEDPYVNVDGKVRNQTLQPIQTR